MRSNEFPKTFSESPKPPSAKTNPRTQAGILTLSPPSAQGDQHPKPHYHCARQPPSPLHFPRFPSPHYHHGQQERSGGWNHQLLLCCPRHLKLELRELTRAVTGKNPCLGRKHQTSQCRGHNAVYLSCCQRKKGKICFAG